MHVHVHCVHVHLLYMYHSNVPIHTLHDAVHVYIQLKVDINFDATLCCLAVQVFRDVLAPVLLDETSRVFANINEYVL